MEVLIWNACLLIGHLRFLSAIDPDDGVLVFHLMFLVFLNILMQSSTFWCKSSFLKLFGNPTNSVAYPLLFSTGLWVGICKKMAQHMGAALCLLDLPLHRSDIGLLGLPCCLPPTSTQTKESLKWQSLAHHYFTLLDASNVIRTSAFHFSSHVRLLDLVSLLNSRFEPAGKNF
jgi:hypothetical protein